MAAEGCVVTCFYYNYIIIIIIILPGGTSIVFIHHLSKRRSQVEDKLIIMFMRSDLLFLFQNPFKSLKGLVQKVIFHPSRPFFFVAVS